MLTQPTLIPMPFANSGDANTIPETNTTPSTTSAASWTSGFPVINSTPLAAGGIPPAREDFNGTFKALSEHIMWEQSGNPYEWSEDLDYVTNARIQGSDAKIYIAKQASGPNTPDGAQDPTLDDTDTYWILEEDLYGGIGEPVGTIIWSANATVPAGYLLCNGAAVGRATYPELFDAIGTTYGAGDGSTTFNLPNLIDKFIEGSNVAGTVKAAGLPNITGSVSKIYTIGTTSLGYDAFSLSDKAGNGSANGGSDQWAVMTFDASRSNSIYGNSTTVQPPAVTALPCIKAFASVVGDATIVAGQLVNEIQSKVALDGSNTSSIGSTLSTYMANAAMPKPTGYIDISITQNNFQYTAPADGWLNWSFIASNQSYFQMQNSTSGFIAKTVAVSTAHAHALYLPCSKGDKIEFSWQIAASSYTLRFFYANGSAS